MNEHAREPRRQDAPRLRRHATSQRSPVRVLMLHGMGGGPGSWDALDPLLAPHLELWDVGLPWAITGDPDWARESDVWQWLSAPVEQFRRATGRGPDVIIAHSFAANVVLELLVESDVLGTVATVLLSPFYRDTPEDVDWSTVVPGMERCYTRVAEEILRRRGSRVGDDASNVITRRMLEFVGAHAPVRFYETIQRTPLLALESLTMPVLVVGGDRDEFGAHADDVHALARRIPYATLNIVEDCGHFPMTERALELAALIDSFVDQVVRTSPTMSTQEPQ